MTPSRKPVTKSQTNPPRSSWQRRFVQASRCPRSLQPSGATPNQNVPRPQLAPRQARPPWAPLALPPPARPPSRRGRSAEPSGGARGAAATETRPAKLQQSDPKARRQSPAHGGLPVWWERTALAGPAHAWVPLLSKLLEARVSGYNGCRNSIEQRRENIHQSE